MRSIFNGKKWVTINTPKEKETETSYFDNGKIKFQVQLEKGKRHGKAIWYYENGQTNKIISYNKGKKNGVYRFWDTNGNIINITIYRDDVRHGIQNIFIDETKKTKYFIFDNEVYKNTYDKHCLVEQLSGVEG